MKLYHGSANIQRNLAQFDGFDLSHRPNGTRRKFTGIDSLGVWTSASKADASVFARSTDIPGVVVTIDFTPKNTAVFTLASFDKWVDAEAKRQRKQRYNMDTTPLREQLQSNGSNCARITGGGAGDPVPDGADYWIILDPKDARVVDVAPNDVVERINGLLCERAGDAPRTAAAMRMLRKLRNYLSEMLGVAEAEAARAREHYAAPATKHSSDDVEEVEYTRIGMGLELASQVYSALRKRGLVFPLADTDYAAGVSVQNFALIVMPKSGMKPVADKDERRKLSPLMFAFSDRLPVGGYFEDRRPDVSILALSVPHETHHRQDDDTFDKPAITIRRMLEVLGPYGSAESSFIHEYTHYLDAMYTAKPVWHNSIKASSAAGWRLDTGNDAARSAARNAYYTGAHEVNARITQLYHTVLLAVKNTALTIQSRLRDPNFGAKPESKYQSYLAVKSPFKDEKNPTHYAALLILEFLRQQHPFAVPKLFANMHARTIVPDDVLNRPENAKLKRKVLTRLTQLAGEAMSWVGTQAKRISTDVLRNDDDTMNGINYGMRAKGAASRKTKAAN